MTDAESIKLVSVLKAAWPRQVVEADTIRVYSAYLRDLDFDAAKEAVDRIVCSAKFFPTIAEVRQEVANGVTCELPAADEAWGLVRRAIGKYGYYRTPVFNYEQVAAAVDVIGWRNICTEENVASTRKRFTDAYRSIRGRTHTAVQLGKYSPARMLPEGERRTGNLVDFDRILRLAGRGHNEA